MKKINVEKLLKKFKKIKKEEILIDEREMLIPYERLQLPMNPWLEEVFPKIQRK